MDRDDPMTGTGVREPPASILAERAILGAILANNKAMDLCGTLAAEHFAEPLNGRIFRECRRIIDAGRMVDVVTLKATFENAGVLDEVGGPAYLVTLLSSMVGLNTVTEYARVVYDAWLRREIIGIGGEAVDRAFGGEAGVAGGDIISSTVDRLLDLGRSEVAGAPSGSLADSIDAVLSASDAAGRGVRTGMGLMTGIATLDGMWRGMWPGTLTILAARAEHGKTAMGMQIAEAVATDLLDAGDVPVGHVQIFSLEMSRDHLATRMLASATGISSDDIRHGRISIAGASALVAARTRLRELPMVIQDRPGMTLSDIRTEAMIARRRRHTRLIVIDHLHRIKPDRAVARAQPLEQVQHATEGLKDLSKMLGVPILLLAQASRATDRRDDPRPKISDIKYAGEADADDVIMLWRPELYMGSAPPEQPARVSAEKRAEADAAWWAKRDVMRGRAEIIFAKRRFGPTGSLWLNFDGPRTRFFQPPDATTRDLWDAPDGGWVP